MSSVIDWAGPVSALNASPTEQTLLDEAANNVPRRDVDLLNERRRVRRGMQAPIPQRGHLSAGLSGEAEDLESLLSGGADRPQYVRRATGNRDQHVAGAAETEDLPLEYRS